MTDFWLSSGHHLVDHDADGRLVATDAFLKAYLARPEIVPPDDACLVERGLHDRLLRAPREPIEADEIAHIADRDARENWRHLSAFRDSIVGQPTLEAAYLAFARTPKLNLPPLFLNQLVHLILRNLLDAETDAFRLRAAEMFFRAQRLTIKDGVMLLADEELVDGTAVIDHASPLVAIFGDAKARDLDVLTASNAPAYFGRSDGFDMVLDFRHGQPARTAFARVIERWVSHMLGVEVTVTPTERVEEQNWAWFVGLDTEGTRIGNALWRGQEPADNGRERIVALFRMDFVDPREMEPKVAGQPVWMILAMTPNRIIRVKPQNLLAGLPLRTRAALS